MYAQKDYPQQLGNGSYTLAEAGCFITTFCNALEALNGVGPDPATLNQYFVEHGLFLPDPNGSNENLAWSSITQYDPLITVQVVGQGSLPPNTPAAVKFHYNSIHTGQPVDHFCWVDHLEGDQVFIVDSWDGQVKSPSGYEGVYGKPVAWATYAKVAPEPVEQEKPTPRSLPAAPVAAASPRYNVIVKDIPGYLTASSAASRTNPVTTVRAGGDYFRFTSKRGMDNVTLVSGQPGAWVNPADNVPDPIPEPPVPLPVPAPPTLEEIKKTWDDTASIPVTVTEEPEVNWRITYKPFRNRFGEAQARYYVALRDSPVIDVEGRRNTQTMHKFKATPISGTFSKDGVLYARPKSAADKFLWFGIPYDDPEGNLYIKAYEEVRGTVTLPGDSESDDELFNSRTTAAERRVLGTPKPSDYIVYATASVEKGFEAIGKAWDVLAKRKK